MQFLSCVGCHRIGWWITAASRASRFVEYSVSKSAVCVCTFIGAGKPEILSIGNVDNFSLLAAFYTLFWFRIRSGFARFVLSL